MNDATRQFIREHLNDDVPTLALKKAPVGTDLSLALRQIEARQLLKRKVPEWSENEGLLFPPHLAIEQCSSAATASYKARLAKGQRIADLTGGLGIDSYYFSKLSPSVDYVEADPSLCAAARHNFAVMEAPIRVWNATAESFLGQCDTFDCLYLDPSRRDAYGRKTVSVGDCTPDVAALQDLLLSKAPMVMVKLSPMLDLSQALTVLRHVSAIHVTAVGNECKELVFVLERDFAGETELCCAHLLTPQPTLSFTMAEERDCLAALATQPQRFLYEPNAALLKAGCFKLLTRRFDVRKLHRNSHLYTSETLIPDFPGRAFEVERWSAYNKKVRNGLLSGLDKAHLAVRNFPLSVAQLRQALRIAEGGETYLFATTLSHGEKVVIKTKKAAS